MRFFYSFNNLIKWCFLFIFGRYLAEKSTVLFTEDAYYNSLVWQRTPMTSWFHKQTSFNVWKIKGIVVASQQRSPFLYNLTMEPTQSPPQRIPKYKFLLLVSRSSCFEYSCRSSMQTFSLVPVTCSFYRYQYRVTGIVRVVSCAVSFSNHRSCQESYGISLWLKWLRVNPAWTRTKNTFRELIKFSNLLIIHEEETEEVITVKEVCIDMWP